jgi:hypothetical protein
MVDIGHLRPQRAPHLQPRPGARPDPLRR